MRKRHKKRRVNLAYLSYSQQFALSQIASLKSTANRLKCDFCGKTITDGKTSISDGKWNHIAVVYDKSNHKLTFYRNWSKVGESTVTENASNLPEVRVKPITLMGCTPNGTTYTGLMDEVRITKRALTVKEFLTPEHVKGFMLIVR